MILLGFNWVQELTPCVAQAILGTVQGGRHFGHSGLIFETASDMRSAICMRVVLNLVWKLIRTACCDYQGKLGSRERTLCCLGVLISNTRPHYVLGTNFINKLESKVILLSVLVVELGVGFVCAPM